MSIIKKTYGIISKIALKTAACVNCNRTEKQLVGQNNTKNSIFNSENLCIDCEILMHPDHFHGCGFCKRPIREKFSCEICSDGFLEWIKNMIHPVDTLSIMIRYSASKLTEKTIYDSFPLMSVSDRRALPQKSTGILPHGSTGVLPIDQRKFIIRNNDGYYKWPGFYAGVTNKFFNHPITNYNGMTGTTFTDMALSESKYIHKELDDHDKYDIDTNSIEQFNCFPVWIIPKLTNGYDVNSNPNLILNFNIECLRPDLKIFQNILLEILEKNNIHLYEDIQIDINRMTYDQIITVNPYDTRVIKR